MDLNNKRLDQTRENDKLIYELIGNSYFDVRKNGEIWSKIDLSGHPQDEWRRVDRLNSSNGGYRIVTYRHKALNVGRTIFAKYGGHSLIAEKVINHKNGNKSDNRISNLELVTHGENNIHRYQILEGKAPSEKKERIGRSGMIQATLDDLIRDLLTNPNYDIKKDGTVWTKIEKTGKISARNSWREAGFVKKAPEGDKNYYCISYKNKKLRRNRILFAKFNGNLQMDLVVNHIDGNTLNDKPNNLELVTQSDNCEHTYRKLGLRPIAGNRKITPKIAKEIRDLSEKGWTNSQLREKFKLAKSTISYIVNNKTWNKELTIS